MRYIYSDSTALVGIMQLFTTAHLMSEIIADGTHGRGGPGKCEPDVL